MYRDTDNAKLTPGQEAGVSFILNAWEDDVVPAVIVGMSGGKTTMISELVRRLGGYKNDIIYVSMTTDNASHLAPDGVEYASIAKVAEGSKYYNQMCRAKIVILDEFYQYSLKNEPFAVLDRLYKGDSKVVILSSRPKTMVVPDYVRLHMAAAWEWSPRGDLEHHMHDYMEAMKIGFEKQFRRDFGLIDSSVPIYQLLNGSYLGRRPRPSFWQRLKARIARAVR
ncbi:hypothetical protein [Rhizobium phage RHEph12]|nr:hypothetical protein [Rhizobium phage RHEph12]